MFPRPDTCDYNLQIDQNLKSKHRRKQSGHLALSQSKKKNSKHTHQYGKNEKDEKCQVLAKM